MTALHDIQVCELCARGAGGECHVPGCAFWMHDAPTGDTLAAIAGQVYTRPASSGDGGAPTGRTELDDWLDARLPAPSPVPEEGPTGLIERLAEDLRNAWNNGYDGGSTLALLDEAESFGATPEQGEGPATCEACGERVGVGTGWPTGHLCDDGTYSCQPPPDWSRRAPSEPLHG